MEVLSLKKYMKRTAAAVICLMMTVMMLAGTALAADSSVHITNNGSIEKEYDSRVGQSFTPTQNGRLDAIDVKLSKAGYYDAKAYIELYAAGSDGLPTGSALATSGTKSINGNVSIDNWSKFSFSTPYTAEAGTQYIFVLRQIHTYGNLVYAYADNNSYSGGCMLKSHSWRKENGKDMAFRVWLTPAEYTVIFEEGDNGTIVDGETEQTVVYGGSAAEPEVEAGLGYCHTGWSDESFDCVTKNITTTALYEKLTYSVEFLPGSHGSISPEDESLATQTVDYGDDAIEPTIIPDAGYRFIGWNGSFDNITQDVTLTAQYKKESYTVKFLPGEHGRIRSYGPAATQTVIHGFGAFSPIVTADFGYVFIGWDTAFNKVESDLIITARYAPIKFPVTFVVGDYGTFDPDGAPGEQWVIYGGSAVAPTVTPAEGYSFFGWDRPFYSITKPTTITALYIPNYYWVTFKEGTNGTFDETGAPSVQWIRHGSGAQAPTVIPDEGYYFDDWSGSFDNVTSHLIITAQYALKTYTVEFQSGENGIFDDSGADALQTVDHGGSATAPTVIPYTGYSFTGWSTEFDNITQDTIVTAQYQKNSYTVTFESNGGSAVADISALYDTAIEEPAEPIREYYSLGGWYKDAELTNQWDFETDKVGSSDMTLYAKWNADAITNIPLKHTMYVGGRVTWSPQPPNGTWTFDEAYLSGDPQGSPATFTALKKGVTYVTYAANGVNYQIEVTILEALMPVTGQQSTWIWIFGGIGICLAAGAVLLMLKKRRQSVCNE